MSKPRCEHADIKKMSVDWDAVRKRAVETIAEEHNPGGRFLLSVAGAGAIECEHEYDSCPMCDPCTRVKADY